MGTVVGLFVKRETPGERGLPKQPVPDARFTFGGVDGDFNRWRTEEKAGDRQYAVLVLPEETLEELRHEAWPVRPGDLGENVLTRGVPYGEFGDHRRWSLGEVEIEVAKPCEPCDNLALLSYVGQDRCTEFMRTMIGRRGWYARVAREGTIHPGDSVRPST